MLDYTRQLVRAARDHGAPIIHAPLVIDPANKQGWLAHLTFGKVFSRGTVRAEVTPGLFETADEVVRGRIAFDAFVASDSEELLRAGDIERLYFCGITTEFCVAMTMRSAMRLGLKSTLVSDCTATRNRRIQRRVDRSFEPNLLSSREAIEQITGRSVETSY